MCMAKVHVHVCGYMLIKIVDKIIGVGKLIFLGREGGFPMYETLVHFFRYDVMGEGVKVGTKWKIYMETCMF